MEKRAGRKQLPYVAIAKRTALTRQALCTESSGKMLQGEGISATSLPTQQLAPCEHRSPNYLCCYRGGRRCACRCHSCEHAATSKTTSSGTERSRPQPRPTRTTVPTLSMACDL